MVGDRISVELDDNILMIGLNRPEKRNAFDLAMIEQLAAAYERLGEEDEIRVGVLYAHGDHFSAGLDLAEVGPLVAERGPEILAGTGRYDPRSVEGGRPQAGRHGREWHRVDVVDRTGAGLGHRCGQRRRSILPT